MESQQNITIQFTIKYNTQFGQELLVLGSDPALGNWIWQNGKKMKYSEGGFWKLQAELPFSNKIVYKYVIINNHNPIPYLEPGLDREIILQENSSTKIIRNDFWGSEPKIQEIYTGLPGGKLYRSGLAFSPMFDPHKEVYNEYKKYNIDVIVTLNLREEAKKTCWF